MISKIALIMFLGKPIIAYGGMLSYVLLLSTAVVGFLNHKGIHTIPFKWHPRLALTTIIIATIHGLFGLAITFGF